MVPPTAVISGMLAGKLTASPLEACRLPLVSQVAAPKSPEAASQVMPCALACWAMDRNAGELEGSQPPKLKLITGARFWSMAYWLAVLTLFA